MIAAVYQGLFVSIGTEPIKYIDIVNGKSTSGVVVRLEQDFGKSQITVYDTLGKVISNRVQKLGVGAHAIDVPPSGLVQIRKLH